MFRRFSTNYMVLLFCADILFVLIGLTLGIFFRLGHLPFLSQSFNALGINIWLFFAVAIIWVIVFHLHQIYTPSKILYWIDEYQRIFLAHSIASLCLIGFLYLANFQFPRLAYLYFYCISFTSLIGFRSILRYLHRSQRDVGTLVNRVVVVGLGEASIKLTNHLQMQNWPEHELVGFVNEDSLSSEVSFRGKPVLGRLSEINKIVKDNRIDSVVVALPRGANEKLFRLVEALQKTPARINLLPDYFDLAFHRSTVEHLGDVPLVSLHNPIPGGLNLIGKRVLDIVVSGIGLFMLSPLMVAIAAAIKIEDNGPIFYIADRVGQNGRNFGMFKFRSMCLNADQMQDAINQTDGHGNLIHKVEGDPRITKVGGFIRKTSLDELPQLYNVLRGDMSLVGPRPELPWLVKEYESWQHKRFAVPQGITGWWQVNGRSDKPMHLSTELDLYYVQHHSLLFDLRILWRTIGVVLRGRGAY